MILIIVSYLLLVSFIFWQNFQGACVLLGPSFLFFGPPRKRFSQIGPWQNELRFWTRVGARARGVEVTHLVTISHGADPLGPEAQIVSPGHLSKSFSRKIKKQKVRLRRYFLMWGFCVTC